MPTYVLPQVLVFQDFTQSPVSVLHPLRAHISGGHAFLVRYSETDERVKGELGYYDNLLATTYDFPNRPAGGLIDPSYTKLWMQNALLQYFETTVGGGSDITKVSNYNNRVHSASLSFGAVGSTYPRSVEFLRDVKPGDVVKVRGLDNLSNPVTLWSSVKALIGEDVAATVGTASADSGNKTNQSNTNTITQTAGDINCVDATANSTAYNGLATGDIIETYDILVVEGSINSNLETASLRVISGSGRDDQAAVTPAASGQPTSIGTRGLTVTFTVNGTISCSASATTEDVSPSDLIVGQRWHVTVHQAFTEPTATAGGTYTGANDTTYIVTVSRGGKYTDTNKPQISVSTINGIDISGPTTVTAASTFVAVGTLGVTVEFNQTALCKGDKYYITVTAETTGALKTIELTNNMDSAITGGTFLDLTLYILQPVLQVSQDRTNSAPTTNWQQTDTQITVSTAIPGYDSSWAVGGVPVALDVISESTQGYGLMFVEYRAWLSDLCFDVFGIRDVGDLDIQISGALTPDNPLKWGVFQALTNSNGTEVKYTSVCDPSDPASWADMLGILVGRDDVYGLVPLTHDQTVLDLFVAHINDQSSPEQAMWRVMWMNLQGLPTVPVVSAGSTIPNHTQATTTNGLVCLATITDDPQSAGTQYTIVTCTSGNAGFIANGVRPGDIVRAIYTGDGFGNFTYSEFIVDVVTSQEQLRLLAGPAAPVNVAAKIEVWRNLNATEESAAIATYAGSFGNRRVRATWPDTITSGTTVMDGMFLNCALSGLSSGILPHQGMTHLAIAGYTDVSRTTKHFNRTQLDAMALAGVWIVTQDLVDGTVFTRHAVTTGSNADINQREEMVTRNVDSISFRFQEAFAPYIGVKNVTPRVQAQLRLDTKNLITTLKTESETADLGGQLVDATIVRVAPHTILKDRYVVVLDAVVPYAINNIEIHLVI